MRGTKIYHTMIASGVGRAQRVASVDLLNAARYLFPKFAFSGSRTGAFPRLYYSAQTQARI